MKLTDLDPEWVTYAGSGALRRFSDAHAHVIYHADSDGFVDAPNSGLAFGAADGVAFLCPACFEKNGGAIGTESVICWFAGRGAPADARPGPGRWLATGASFDDLTLRPSINVAHGHWHGFVANGQVK